MSSMGQASVLKFGKYLKERFPVVPLSLYSILTALAINSTFKTINYAKVFIIAIIYVLFLFHLRVLDEFKDYQYDSRNHEDRPIQSGLVSLSFIKNIGILNFSILISLALFISLPNVFILFLLTIMYTGLMYREFFASDFLRQRPVLYLISHEIVLIPLFLFFYSVFNKSFWLITDLSRLSLFIYTLIPIVLIEIGRKLKHRYSKEGKKTNDTYVYIWGEKNSIRIFAIIIFISGFLSFFIKDFNIYFSSIIVITSFTVFLGSYLFPKLIINKSMIITSVLALSLPSLLLL